MQRRKSQISIEVPHAPLSKRDDNKAIIPPVDRKAPKARPSLSTMRVEIPVKATPKSKSKTKTEDQNTEPTPGTSDHARKRKRSISELVGSSVVDSKKAKGLEQGKTSHKPTGHAKVTNVVPQPKWTPIPTDISYDEIMQRMQLREFLARFQPLTKLAQAHLDTLSCLSAPTHQYIPKATLKAILLVLVDLVGVDATPELRQGCQVTVRYIRTARGNLAATWDALAELRRTCCPDIPNPERPPSDDVSFDDKSEGEDEENGRITRQTSRVARLSQPSLPPKDSSLNFSLACGAQFLPILVFLAERALQSPSIRADIDAGLRALSTAAQKSHATKLAEEKSRWAEQRQKFSTTLATLEATKSKEKSAAIATGSKVVRGSSTNVKIKELKSKRKAAEASHQRTVRGLSVAYSLELRACASRGTYLGSDRLGRQYFTLLLAPRSAHGENRWDHWSTFVSCWGSKVDGMQPRWYGFDDPSELRTLASALEQDDGRGSISPKDHDSLVKSLLTYAEFLDDRLKD